MVDIEFDTSATEMYSNALALFSKTLSRYAVTRTLDNGTADESFAYATAVSISGVFYPRNSTFAQGREGLFGDADAILLILPTVTLNKNDKVSYNSVMYRVTTEEAPIARQIGTQSFYKVAKLFKIGTA